MRSGHGCPCVTDDAEQDSTYPVLAWEAVRLVEHMIDRVTHSTYSAASSAARDAASADEKAKSVSERRAETDAVELSTAAQRELAGDESAPIRTELVARVRAEIAAGTYLTEDKLNVAVSRIHELLVATA